IPILHHLLIVAGQFPTPMSRAMAGVAEADQVGQYVSAAPAQRSDMMHFEAAFISVASVALLAGVIIAYQGGFANESPLRTASSPSALRRAETVLSALLSEALPARGVGAFDFCSRLNCHCRRCCH